MSVSMLVGLGEGTHLLEVFLLRVQLLQHDLLGRVQLVQQHLNKTVAAVRQCVQKCKLLLHCPVAWQAFTVCISVTCQTFAASPNKIHLFPLSCHGCLSEIHALSHALLGGLQRMIDTLLHQIKSRKVSIPIADGVSPPNPTSNPRPEIYVHRSLTVSSNVWSFDLGCKQALGTEHAAYVLR